MIIKEYIEKISKVSRENIIDFAKSVKINTIYFLTNTDN